MKLSIRVIMQYSENGILKKGNKLTNTGFPIYNVYICECHMCIPLHISFHWVKIGDFCVSSLSTPTSLFNGSKWTCQNAYKPTFE